MRKLRNKEELLDNINNLIDKYGIKKRVININGIDIYILYLSVVTDREALSKNIIKPILQYNKDEILTIEKISNSVIYTDDITIDDKVKEIINYIINGNTVVIIPGESDYIAANTLRTEKRSISVPEVQTSVKGPRDGFTENLDTNLSLVRNRIPDSTLIIDNIKVGKRTRTEVAILSIEDIVNDNLLRDIKNKIKDIDIDGVFESGYIHKFLKDELDLFPSVGILERADSVCTSLLKGKVCVLVEGSNLALVIPKTFVDFFDAGDDHYDSIFISVFNKLIRKIALIITLVASSLYVAFVGFHPDFIDPRYVLALAISRATVPANSIVEAFVMEFVAEMLKEASIRLPKQIGPAIGIVGTIVIGQAAVAAGLVSPLMVIVVSLVTLSSFIAPDYTIMNPIRLLKYFLIIITGIFGLLGFILGITLIIIHLTSKESFGVPYLSPISPFIYKDFKNYIFSDIRFSKIRPKILRDKDETRQ